MLLLNVYYVRILFLSVSGTAVIFLMLGLYKPWIMLWWEDVQNRKKVIKVYGSVALTTYVTYWILYLFT